MVFVDAAVVLPILGRGSRGQIFKSAIPAIFIAPPLDNNGTDTTIVLEEVHPELFVTITFIVPDAVIAVV